MTATEQNAEVLGTDNQSVLSLLARLKKLEEMNERLQEAHKNEVDSLQSRVKELVAQVAWLNRQLFGRKSEKLQAFDPNQPSLFPDLFPCNAAETEKAREDAVEKIEKEMPQDKKEKRANRKMIEDLPVLKRTVIEPDGVDLESYRKIGEEITRIVHHEPGKLYVEEIVRPKYGLKDNSAPVKSGEGVVIAPMPLLPLYKGIAGATLLAEIILQKYGYHVPFYRQLKQFTHLGMKGLKENTIDGWFKQVAQLLRPLYDALEQEIFNAGYLQGDETTTPVIDSARKKAAKEYLWMVRAVMEGLVLFYYEGGSRAGKVIGRLAKNFKGYFQCDGFVGYETAFKANPDVLLVNCMAHIRRKFESALDENKEMAERALKDIQLLYRVERQCDDAGCTPEQRKAKRQELARPIMEALKLWMETEGTKYSPSSLIGKAVTYAYTRWDNMMRYLDDGRIKIDNNLAENEIRPITLGRKNYLFCGNHEAAENMAVICSLLATCRNHNVNPRDYLKDIIARMPYMKKATHEQLVELLPHKWKPLQDVNSLYTGGVITTTELTK